MGFWLQQMVMTLNDLERQFTALSSELCMFWLNGWARIVESRDFRYKVALYLRYLHIKFDDKIIGNPFEF